MIVLISVGSTNYDKLIRILLKPEYQRVMKQNGVTEIHIQNGKSKLNVLGFQKHFRVFKIKTYSEYLSSLKNCSFGISHCGKWLTMSELLILYVFLFGLQFYLFSWFKIWILIWYCGDNYVSIIISLSSFSLEYDYLKYMLLLIASSSGIII